MSAKSHPAKQTRRRYRPVKRSATGLLEQRRDCHNLRRLVNILLRHAERFRVVLAAGTTQRFGIAPGIQAMLAIGKTVPDPFTGDVAITSICSSAQRGQIIFSSLGAVHRGRFQPRL